MFEDAVAAWALSSWPAAILEPDDDFNYDLWSYVNDRCVLAHVVRTGLLPQLPEEVADAVMFVGSVHNPLRVVRENAAVERKDGASWLYWAERQLGGVVVSVSQGEIAALCEEFFPARSRAWLALHAVLSRDYALVRELRTGPPTSWEVPGHCRPSVDAYFARLGDDGCRLLTEMFRQNHDPWSDPISASTFEDLVRVAEVCCSPQLVRGS
jgi:hypothetical protein